jgi:hypothetical protein
MDGVGSMSRSAFPLYLKISGILRIAILRFRQPMALRLPMNRKHVDYEFFKKVKSNPDLPTKWNLIIQLRNVRETDHFRLNNI